MFTVIKEINRSKPKVPLLLKTLDGGLTSNDKQQTKIIKDHFEKQFHQDIHESENVEKIQPVKTTIPFTAEEVEKAAKKLKNNKSAGIDEIKPELIKYAPKEVFQEIATILNTIAENGNYPNELIHGKLCALQKPGKKRGPTENLRPIILFSTIRKITAICLSERIKSKMNNEIPISQAAYRSGRSTTEHIFTMKILAERASISKNETIHLALMDMSKAFDCIDRNKLLEDLSKILEKDELYLTKILLETELSVRCGRELSDPFKTDTGAPQGDCLSAIEFTYYLAKTLELDTEKEQQMDTLNIELQYADDISIITNDYQIIEQAKTDLPAILGSRGLKMNITKNGRVQY